MFSLVFLILIICSHYKRWTFNTIITNCQFNMRIRRSFLLLFVYFILNIYKVCNTNGASMEKQNKLRSGFYPDFVNAIVEDSTKEEDTNTKNKRAHKRQTNFDSKVTNIIENAAKTAVDATAVQNINAEKASEQVKTKLAGNAMQTKEAAETVETTLAGKQKILEKFDQQMAKLHVALENAMTSLENSKTSVHESQRAADQIRHQIKVLTDAAHVAQSNIDNAEEAARSAQTDYNGKVALLDATKQRLQQLLSELQKAREEFSDTKSAAYEAVRAAQKATINAQKNRRNNMNKPKVRLNNVIDSNMIYDLHNNRKAHY